MTDDQRPQSRKLVKQKVGPVDKRRRPRGLTPAIRTCIDAIVHDRCTRAEACKRAGISERAIYLGLQKIEVAAYWNAQIDVLKAAERAHNIFTLIEVRDGEGHANPMARVQAARSLESMADATPFSGGITDRNRPGVVIQIVTAAPATSAGVMLDVTPEPIKPD